MSEIFKIEMMCIFNIVAVMFGLEVWKHIEKSNFHWWTIPFAVITVAAFVLAVRLLWDLMWNSQEEKPEP